MKPTGWLKHLATAGLCLIWAGCGGGDVPDPASDSLAASEPSAPVARPAAPSAPADPAPEPAAAPAPAAAPETASAPAAPPTPTPVAATPAPAVVEPTHLAAVNPEPTPAPESTPAPTTTDTPKGDTSGTDEMLRMGGAPAPAAASGDQTSSAPAPATTPAPAVAATEAAAVPAVAAAAVGNQAGARDDARGADAAPAPTPGPRMRARNPELAGPGGDQAGRRSGDEMQAPAGADGAPGGPGGRPAIASSGRFGGGSGPDNDSADLGPGAFRTPGTAVQAFLSALKAKNKDRLSQTTAHRAATESVEKHRKIFAAILEQSISDEELDDMAKTLEGYQVMAVLPAKSTGTNGVLIGRMDNRDQLQRTVIVRKEKEGWKVMDFVGFIDQKPIGTMRNPYGRRR